MTSWAIVDAGPLISNALKDDPLHRRVAGMLADPSREFVVAGLALAEAAYFVSKHRGGLEETAFIQDVLDNVTIELPSPEDWPRIVELMRQYADFPLGLVDASVVALAERLEIDTIATLDHRHFRAVRPRHCPAFTLLP